jgi:CO/xanthine dehydrogenase Mo-binding subunit
MPVVGKNVPRKDGPEKLTGRTLYIDDVELPGCLHGVTYRSTVARARIKAIHFDPAFPWDEYVITSAEEIPGANSVLLLDKEQPLLASSRVMHAMEPILLLAHADRQRAYEALSHIRVDYIEEEPVLTMEDSLAKKSVIYGSDNVFKDITIDKGDMKAGWRRAHKIIEGEYRVPHQEQTYIENQGMAAYLDKDGTLVVIGSLQCPYYVVKALGPIFALPEERIRVIQTATGGGFGGKEDYPNMLAGHAALLAIKAKRPVKMIYDRHEDMLATTKRHPAIIRHKTGITRDGKLTALEIDIVMDGGAYMTLSPVVLSRGILHATGPYSCPNVDIHARVVATNTPPNGAFRGFGAPQTLFGSELHWEKIAAVLKKDSLALRRKNLVTTGSTMPTGQVLKTSVSAKKVVDSAVKMSGYGKKRAAYDKWNANKSKPTWKGVGLAAVHHGAGFTGNGEVYLASKATLTLTRSGHIRIDVAAAEMGQGSTSTLAQITADAIGVPYDWVEVQQPDTRRVPDSGPTVASRTCMIVGGLLHRAGNQMREALKAEIEKIPRTRDELIHVARKLCDNRPEIHFTVEYEKPPEIDFDDKKYRGDAYGSYGFACGVVDLEIDRTTYEVKLTHFWTAQDIGKAIHPLIVEGQIIGGTVQGLGWALLEKPVYDKGVMQNPQLTNYIIPTSMDVPPIDVDIVEAPYSRGPFGAKGVGEMPMDVPAPAVAAAIHHATGHLIPEIPITPEAIEKALNA